MDELQLLRQMRSEVGSAPQATLARGRNKLLKNIGVESGPSVKSQAPRSRSIPRRVALGSAAAALLVGAFVAADVIVPGSHGGATAEAAEVLNNAAVATIQTSDPVVGPGQYLKVETTSLTWGGMQAADGSDLSWQETTGGQVYVPADRGGEWVWNREDRVPIESSSEAAKAAAAEQAKARAAKARTPEALAAGVRTQSVGILRAPGGAFYGNKPEVLKGTPLNEASSLPRDPRDLLDLIYERTEGAGKSPEHEAFVTIADGLRTGVVPADLRAALFKAAALIPGVTVGDKQATVDGRTGVAVGIPSPDGVARTDIIIDPTSGLVLGEQDVCLKDYPGFPAGTVSSWTSVHTSVVSSAP